MKKGMKNRRVTAGNFRRAARAACARMKIVCFIFSAAAAISGCGGGTPIPAASPEADRAAVEARMNQFAAAFAAEDYADLFSMLSPDKRFSESWQSFFDNNVVYSFILSDLKITATGNAAIVTGTENRSYDNAPSSANPKKTAITTSMQWAWEKTDGVWLLKHLFTTSGCIVSSNQFIRKGEQYLLSGYMNYYTLTGPTISTTDAVAELASGEGGSQQLAIGADKKISHILIAPVAAGEAVLVVDINGMKDAELSGSCRIEHVFMVTD
jgi:ketosteroid isomerase-like protein